MRKVAVAVIMDKAEHILITRRPMHTSHGGFWEFPGGKVEPDEEVTSALIREIDEEVGLQVIAYDYLGEVLSTYQEQPLALLIYHVYHYVGEAYCREGQMDLRWVAIEDLEDFQFPAANVAIIGLIKSGQHQLGVD